MPQYPLWKADALTAALRYGFRMRTAPALLVAALVVGTLAGCVPDDEPVRPDPSPTVEPIFESDEEALAAAVEAYGAYLAVVDEISADGGANPERLKKVATASVYEYELTGFQSYQSESKRTVGTTLVDTVSLQSADLSGYSVTGAVAIYACEDYSQVDVLDSDGNSVVAAERKTRWPITVSFDLTGTPSAPLIVAAVEDWTGTDYCEE